MGGRQKIVKYVETFKEKSHQSSLFLSNADLKSMYEEKNSNINCHKLKLFWCQNALGNSSKAKFPARMWQCIYRIKKLYLKNFQSDWLSTISIEKTLNGCETLLLGDTRWTSYQIFTWHLLNFSSTTNHGWWLLKKSCLNYTTPSINNSCCL